MKFTALLASAFVATAVQASEVSINYCQGDDNCFDTTAEPYACKTLEHPGRLTSIQNTAECELFNFSHCGGRSFLVPRGSNLLQREYVASVRCHKPGFSRNLAPVVQASEVEIDYCRENGPCGKDFVEPYECNDLVYPGRLSSFQNTADCKLYEYPGCDGRNFLVKRGSHDIKELRGKIVESFECSEPGLPRNLAPAVQAEEVEVKYCVQGGPCIDTSVEPDECENLNYPYYLSSFQNTADCTLFQRPGCGGRNFHVSRGSHDIKELRDKIVGSFKCSEPGLPRALAPAVESSDVTINYCLGERCFDQVVAPYKCTYLNAPGPITSIQNTANCELFANPHCAGNSIPVRRGSSTLQGPYVETIECSEPGFQRNQRPMRRH